MATYTKIAEHIAALPAYRLADMASAYIDNDEARAFFERIRDAFVEAIDYDEGKPSDDAMAEIADDAPSVYNYQRMMQAIGTRAYLVPSDLASGGEDMITLAGFVLYELAMDLVYHLAEYYDETAEELDDDEDEDA